MQTFYSIHDCYISHHGIKGQKWGVRRWRNEDGTLTEAGKRKYEKLLQKYTTTDSRGNVHLNEGKLARRSSVRGTAIATSAAMLGNRAAAVKLATQNRTKASNSLVTEQNLLKSDLNRYKNAAAGSNDERLASAQVSYRLGGIKASQEWRDDEEKKLNKELNTQKKVRAVAAGITAVSAISAAKEMKDLKFLMDNASAYGGKSVASLEKEIKENRSKRVARTTANATGVLLSYHFFSK